MYFYTFFPFQSLFRNSKSFFKQNFFDFLPDAIMIIFAMCTLQTKNKDFVL